MKVILINRQNKIDLDLELVKKASKYISNKFDNEDSCELNIIFVEKKEIKELNKKYRNTDRVTDVLSFSYSDDDLVNFEESADKFKDTGEFITIGEIIICPEAANEYSKTQKEMWNLNMEILLLIIHGLLHIYNYDHEKKEDTIKMESIQNSIFRDVKSVFKL